MQLMNKVFRDFIDKCVLVYLDDILVFSQSLNQHIEDVRKVLEILRKEKLYANSKKCEFLLEKIEFLGYQIGNNKIEPSQSKVKCILDWPILTNVKEVRSFLGLAGYYRRFIKDFAQIAAPLTDLTKQDFDFKMGEAEMNAFNTLKKILCNSPVLRLPNFQNKFFIETDASGVAIGAVLLQEFEDGKHPIAYESKKLTSAEMNYPVHEQELYAIVHACKTFRCYVVGNHFTILTDHASLQFVKEQKNLSRRVTRWVQFLAQFDFEILYRKGEENTVADALSRISQREVCEIDATDWPSQLMESLSTGEEPNDAELKELFQKEKENFEVEDEILYRKDQGKRLAFVPFLFRADLIERTHRSLGHLGWQGVYENLKERYWFPAMKSLVKQLVNTCLSCQRVSNTNHAKHEPIHFLPVVPAFHRWSLDFIGILPETVQGNRWILAAIDHTTKWPIARAIKDATSAAVAQFIYEEILVRFGCPAEILTDRGANFLSDMLEEYLSHQRIKHLKTSAYHPRTNGMVERFNGTFGRMLSRFINNNVKIWDQFIDQALFACRVRTHKATGHSPFFMVYGKHPKIPGDILEPMMLTDQEEKASVEGRIAQLVELGMERKNAERKVEHERMLLQKRQEEEIEYFSFYPGDMVMLQVMNAKKFEANFEGPFAVIRKGPCGTYKLLHPDGREKEDLVNVQRLKIAHLSDEQFQKLFSEKAKSILLRYIQEFEKEEDVVLKERGMLGLVLLEQSNDKMESNETKEINDLLVLDVNTIEVFN